MHSVRIIGGGPLDGHVLEMSRELDDGERYVIRKDGCDVTTPRHTYRYCSIRNAWVYEADSAEARGS